MVIEGLSELRVVESGSWLAHRHGPAGLRPQLPKLQLAEQGLAETEAPNPNSALLLCIVRTPKSSN